MHATELSELAAFLAVARHRSFRRAAVERGITPSGVSHAVRSLEERVGVRLLNRTTRSVSLTEAGEMFFTRLQPAFGGIGDALEALNDYRDTPFGTIRITVPASIAPFVMGPVMAPLLQGNPGLQLEVVATDRLVDIVAEGFDAGIRLGERLSQDMLAVRIKPALRFAVVGAPGYFKGRRKPRSPHDLKDHVGIRCRFPSGEGYPWTFERDGQLLDVDVQGPLVLDDQDLMIEAATAGLGLAYVWERRAKPRLDDGRLVQCLADWCTPDELFLYYPSRKQMPGGLKALIQLIRA